MPEATANLDGLMVRFQTALDQGAFEQLVSALLRPAVGVARQLLRDVASAEDAVQEAFLRVVQNRDAYDSHRPFSTWFYAILRNVCLDALRRRRRDPLHLEEIAGGPEAIRDVRKSNEADVRELLAMLPEHERQVLELRAVHGLPFSDIASALGIAEEAAKKRAQRGLHRLRERLIEPAGAPVRSSARPEMSALSVVH